MNSSLLSQRTLSLSSTLLRTPLIRFRYGASREQKGAPAASASGAGPQPSASIRPQTSEPIYDFQIPLRWKRRPISEEEIAYINRGGPE